MRQVIYVLIFVFVLSSVNAAFTDNQEMYLTFTSDGSDEYGLYDFTCTGIGFGDGYADFESSESDYCVYAGQTISDGFGAGDTIDFTLCIYDYIPETLTDYQVIWGEQDGVDDAIILRSYTSKINMWLANLDSTTSPSNGVSMSICITYDETLDDVYLYINDNSAEDSNLNYDIDKSSTSETRIGSLTGGGSFLDGKINEICAWSRVLGSAELTEFMNYGCTGEGISGPTLTINTNLQNNTINFNELNLDINFNGTITDSAETIFQCNIFNDGDIINSGDYNLTINNQVTINNPNVEENYLLSIECSNQVEYFPLEYNITGGTYTSGVISNLDDEGQNFLKFNEDNSAPALDITFGYENITSFDRLHYIVNVSGSEAHTIQLQVYNYTLDDWKIINTDLNTGYTNIEYDLYYTDLINGGEALVRVYMSGVGNINHYIEIDYLEFETVGLNDTTGQYLYRIDTVQPKLNPTIENDTAYFLGDTVSDTVLANDTNLFATNYSFFDANKIELKNYFSENITSNYTSTVISYTPTQVGTYYIRYEAWDSHNHKEKPHEKYDKIEKVGDKTKIKFKKGDISLGGEDVENIQLISEKNKYSVIYEFKQKGKNTIFLDNAHEWYKDIDSSYKGHLVNSKLKKYYDLEGIQVDDMYINDLNQWVLEVDSYDEKTVKTNSIGDLNFNYLEYTFSVATVSTATNLSGVEDAIDRAATSLSNIWWWFLFCTGMIFTGYTLSLRGRDTTLIRSFASLMWLAALVTLYTENILEGLGLQLITYLIIGILLVVNSEVLNN